MELEKIDRIIKDSLSHGNSTTHPPVFTKEQVELLSETIKAAFEEYHKQTQ